jgi:hypothetical protein
MDIVMTINVALDNLAWLVKIACDHRGRTGRNMKSYVVRFSDGEEGPYDETRMAQIYADGRIDRNTPCKPAVGGEWKSVDDYLPMLKYGTQLPPATKLPAVPPVPPPISLSQLSQRVSIVDFDIPFGSVLKIMFKWIAAALVVVCCFLPVIFILWLIVAAIFAALFSGAMYTFHQP